MMQMSNGPNLKFSIEYRAARTKDAARLRADCRTESSFSPVCWAMISYYSKRRVDCVTRALLWLLGAVSLLYSSSIGGAKPTCWFSVRTYRTVVL